MPQATIAFGSVHEQTKWSATLLQEYLNGNQFRPFMRSGELRGSSVGDATNGVIAVIDALGNKAGTVINIPLRRALTGAGVTGDQVLMGNEEELVFDNESIRIDLFRHAVSIQNPEMSEQRAAFQIWEEARPALSDWSEEKLNQEIIDALTDVSRGRVQARYLYGSKETNYNATHATALGNLTITSDKMSVAFLKKLKDKAKTGVTGSGVGRIRPAKVTMDNGVMKKNYVVFMGSRARRDLEADPAFQNIQFNGKDVGAPKFVDTSNYIGIVDGMMLYEIEGWPVYTGTGSAGADTAPVVLSGAQSVAIVYGKRPWFTQRTDDYGAFMGVAINEIRRTNKLVFNGANYGVVNGFVALSAA